MSNQLQKKQGSSNNVPSQAQAPKQAPGLGQQPQSPVPLSVTLGQSRSNPTPTLSDNQNQTASVSDVVMESEGNNSQPAPVKSSSSNNGVVEDLEVHGDTPQARFGHTITTVSKTKLCCLVVPLVTLASTP